MIYLLCFAASAFGSLLVGGIGTGSSLVILPTLVLVLDQVLPQVDAIRYAAGTTMAVIAVGAISGGISRYRAKQVDVSLIRLLAIPYIVGALLGPWLASCLPVSALRIYVAGLIIIVAVRLVFVARPMSENLRSIEGHEFQIAVIMTLIALLSSLGGIASGIFAIPYLMRFSLPMNTIVGTSTVGAGIFASFATIGYVSAGIGAANAPAASLGFVYLPVFILMAGTAAVFTPLGVQLSKHFNETLIKQILAGFLLVSAAVIFSDGFGF